ncbi:HET-domain-containing protein [Apiospora arundinis]
MSDSAITLWNGREPRLLTGLCQYCTYTFAFRRITYGYNVPWNRRVQYPELTELLSSGCPACEIFAHGIRWHMSQPQPGSTPDMTKWRGDILLKMVTVQMDTHVNFQIPAHEDGPSQFHLNILYGEDHCCILRVPFNIYGRLDSEVALKRIRGRVPSLKSLSPANSTAIKAYLKNCSETHTICRLNQNTELPSRLVDVEAEPKGVRLVRTDNLPAGTSYTALSHVWGSPRTTPPFLVTTLKNLSSMKEFVQLESLPQTFQDAVETTRALGLRYVWIDSLCIIQDCAEDWMHEAPRMAKIYSNAYITIVATSATSAHHGFLERAVSDIRPAKMPYCISGKASTEAGFCYMQTKYSSSILIFVECWSGDWSEDNRVSGDLLINRMPWLGGRASSGESSEDSEAILRSWYYIVEAYTCRSLTMEQDKLLALSGVMKRISEITGFTNVAGLWKEDFAEGLLWTMPNFEPRRRKLRHPQGPSWSWATWDGPISCHPCFHTSGHEGKTSCFEVLHIGLVQSPFIPDTGHLRVKGVLIPVDRTILIAKNCDISLDIEYDESGPPAW